MDLIADALLLAGALSAAFYCWALSRRVKSLNDLDKGVGSAIANLSSQVGEMQTALKATQSVTGASIAEMEELAERAERAAENLRLMLATVQEDKAEVETLPRKTRRVRKFPSSLKTKSEPEVALEKPAPAKTEPKKEREKTDSPARQLQKDVVEKMLDRDEDRSREQLVEALQSILAASK